MTLGQPDSTEPAGRLGGQFWFWHFQNIQCQWFQLHVGADGRTTGTGAPTMIPGLRRAQLTRRYRGRYQNGPPTHWVVAMPSSMLP